MITIAISTAIFSAIGFRWAGMTWWEVIKILWGAILGAGCLWYAYAVACAI
jgi:hypothetical protein